jgi:hypothetical protein
VRGLDNKKGREREREREGEREVRENLMREKEQIRKGEI